MKFGILSCVHNAEKFIQKHLDSVREQKRCNYVHFVVDDGSTDSTPDILAEELNRRGTDLLVLNKPQRMGTVHSWRLGMEHLPIKHDDVVVELDGDDSFAHDRVLARIEQEYTDGHLATYGNYRVEHDPNDWDRPIPPHMATSRCGPKILGIPLRKQILEPGWRYSAVRTFKKFLYHKIPKEAWVDKEGVPFVHCKDIVYFLPILELIGLENVAFIDEELMVYNYHLHNDFVPNSLGCGHGEQERIARILSKRDGFPKLSEYSKLDVSQVF